MRRLIDIGFLFLIALGCVGLDFYIQKRDSTADQFGVADYIALRRDAFNDILHPPSLAAAMPSDIAGWEIAQSGADQMVGVTDANRQDQANEVALVRAVAAFAKASAPKGEMRGMTMVKGDTRLRVVATLAEQVGAAAGIESAAQAAPTDSAALQNLLQPSSAAQAGRAVYDVVDGVAFTELPLSGVTSDPDMRMMRATLGNDLAVTVVTQSSDDAAIKEALQGIDFVMLNKLLNSPVTGVQDGSKTDLRADQGATPMAAAAPEPVPTGVPTAIDQAAALVDQMAGGQTDASGTTAKAAAPAPVAKAVHAETAVFITPPESAGGTAAQPCVRRAGVLVCPDG